MRLTTEEEKRLEELVEKRSRKEKDLSEKDIDFLFEVISELNDTVELLEDEIGEMIAGEGW